MASAAQKGLGTEGKEKSLLKTFTQRRTQKSDKGRNTLDTLLARLNELTNAYMEGGNRLNFDEKALLFLKSVEEKQQDDISLLLTYFEKDLHVMEQIEKAQSIKTQVLEKKRNLQQIVSSVLASNEKVGLSDEGEKKVENVIFSNRLKTSDSVNTELERQSGRNLTSEACEEIFRANMEYWKVVEHFRKESFSLLDKILVSLARSFEVVKEISEGYPELSKAIQLPLPKKKRRYSVPAVLPPAFGKVNEDGK